MIDGKEILSRLGKLRDVTCSKDIAQLTYAMFPGTHCPLMGAAMAVRGIQDAVLLVVGTDECAYYTKHMTIHSDDFGGLQGRCVSAVLDTRDVTFGCKAKLDQAVAELVAEYSPKAVFHRHHLRRRDHRGRRRRLCRQLLGAVRHPVYGGPHRAL